MRALGAFTLNESLALETFQNREDGGVGEVPFVVEADGDLTCGEPAVCIPQYVHD